MTQHVDCLVIGAGVIGLATARALARAGREVIISEAEDQYGSITSARNSEVIHAGIYYPTGSLKARLCVAGRQQLYDFCNSHGVSARKTTKLIVATTQDEIRTLENLQSKAAENGVSLTPLDAEEAKRLEPELACTAALLSPETGIVDSHGLMTSLLGDAEVHGAVLARATPVLGGRANEKGWLVRFGGADPVEITCQQVINCAGLSAQAVTARFEGVAPGPPQKLGKGNYFSLAGSVPFQRLIYPVPVPGGVGIHFTLDLGGQGRFGPDVEWIDGIDYDVDPSRGTAFYTAVRRYWPSLPDGALQPAYVGIRPKIDMKNGQVSDFMIQFPDETGCPGFTALYGIESPGLTASLAIADYIAERIA